LQVFLSSIYDFVIVVDLKIYHTNNAL